MKSWSGCGEGGACIRCGRELCSFALSSNCLGNCRRNEWWIQVQHGKGAEGLRVPWCTTSWPPVMGNKKRVKSPCFPLLNPSLQTQGIAGAVWMRIHLVGHCCLRFQQARPAKHTKHGGCQVTHVGNKVCKEK